MHLFILKRIISKDVNININDLPPELLNFDENEEINIELQDDETDFETNVNPLDSFRQGASESCANNLTSVKQKSVLKLS